MLRIMNAWRVALFLAATAAWPKSPLTHETMWLMKRVGSPAPSPDGKWVVFSVREPAYDPKDQRSDLWIVPADGSAPPRQLTYSKGGEDGVDWSPDSRRIAFSARRDGDESAQIYVLDVIAGGEARRVTNASSGASDPKFSPDGRSLLYQSDIDPAAAERKKRKYNARVYESFPIRYWDRWLDETRPHLFVQPVEPAPGIQPKDLLAGTRLVTEPGFDGALGTSGSSLGAVWAPDSASVVFMATTERNRAARQEVELHLYQVSTAGGEPRRITDSGASYSSPRFRPDGTALYALAEKSGPNPYNLTRIAMFSWPEPAGAKIVSATLDRSINTFGITPDNRTIYALAEEHGHEKLFRMPAGGGQAELAFEMTLGTYSDLSVPAKAETNLLVGLFDSAVNPKEVVRIEPGQKGHRNLTNFNQPEASEIDWTPPRHFWHTSKTGRKVHSMLFLPPRFDENRKYPLVVLMHGGPHTMARDEYHTRWNYHLLTAPGYAVLTTNYTGSTGFGEKFAQLIERDPLKTPGEEINEAVDEALKKFPFLDATRMAAGGASYGGHLANWLQATTTRYKCLFSHAGLINLESQWGTSDVIYHREVNNGGPVWEQGPVWRTQNPIRYAANFKTPILLTVGERDYRVPLNQTIENWSVLQRLNIPSKLIVFPDENHWILKGENSRYFYQELHAWLGKYLGSS